MRGTNSTHNGGQNHAQTKGQARKKDRKKGGSKKRAGLLAVLSISMAHKFILCMHFMYIFIFVFNMMAQTFNHSSESARQLPQQYCKTTAIWRIWWHNHSSDHGHGGTWLTSTVSNAPEPSTSTCFQSCCNRCSVFPSFLIKMHEKRTFFDWKSQKKEGKPTCLRIASSAPDHQMHHTTAIVRELRSV